MYGACSAGAHGRPRTTVHVIAVYELVYRRSVLFVSRVFISSVLYMRVVVFGRRWE